MMMEKENEKKEPAVKHYQCRECKKKYVKWNKWMTKHIQKYKHNKFKKINEEEFKWRD
jgi:hypothetical protein